MGIIILNMKSPHLVIFDKTGNSVAFSVRRRNKAHFLVHSAACMSAKKLFQVKQSSSESIAFELFASVSFHLKRARNMICS